MKGKPELAYKKWHTLKNKIKAMEWNKHQEP